MAKKRPKRSPAPATPPQPNGRPTHLNQEVQDEIVGYLLEGNFYSVACELAGIPAPTGKEWLRRGLGKMAERPPTDNFASFAYAVKKAQAQAERDAIARIREAAVGRRVLRSKTVTKRYRDREGNEVEEVTTESGETTVYDWRADAWRLERAHPERWGVQRMAELEAWKVLIEAGQVPDEVIDALLAGEEERRSRIKDVLVRNDEDHGTP